MFKIINYLKKSSFFIIVTIFLFCAQITPALAQAPAEGNSIRDLIVTIVSLYNKSIDMVTNLILKVDPQYPAIAASYTTYLQESNKATASALEQTSQQSVNKAMSGVETKMTNLLDLQKIKASDDIINFSGSGNIFQSLFSKNQAQNKGLNQQYIAANAMFNANNFIGTNQYKNPTLAADYVKFLNNMAPPPDVILFGSTVYLPQQGSATPLELTVDSYDHAKQLKEKAETYPEFWNYKRTYRSLIALRSLYLNNIQRIYEERTVPKSQKESVMALRQGQADRRLTEKYYTEMSKATPATVARETLFVLANIHKDLFELRKQNERLILMQSVNGLQSLALTTKMENQAAATIGKQLKSYYCDTILKDKADKPAACTAQTDNAPT